ncbi:hypothetical protein CBS101457_003383 [Exobasidium rhododendri]|nr:hypothetical protein CBS101457_003383 [Exobasidium rhododendri]
MAPASLQLTLFEPVIFLRGQSAVGENGRGRARPINFDAPPSQLRGLLLLTLPKPSKIKEISILLQGRARTDWPEGIGPNRLDTSEESTIFSQKIVLFSAKEGQSGQSRRRANSVGNFADEARDDRSRTNRSQGAQSSPSVPRVGRPLDSERSPTLARSIGNVAARAGTAILPPTLIKELNASRQPSTNQTRSASSSPMRSPLTQRFNVARVSSTHQSNSYFDPPPIYDTSQQSTPSTTSNLSSLANVDAASPSTSPRTIPNTPHTQESSIAATSNAQHPQSVKSAGPSNRSILHPLGRQESRQQINPTAVSAGVRFDPTPINPTWQQQQSACDPTAPTSSNGQGCHSEPSSARTSTELSRSPSANLVSAKGKGKAVNVSMSPGPGSRKGFKGMLANLIKEDEDSQRKSSSSNISSDASSNHHPEGSAAQEDEGDSNEFKKGTYTYPFSIPLPSNLPPTLHADFGSNAYLVRAHVHRVGTLTSNLTCDKEITLVHAPDEDGQDENDAIVVERNWDDCLRYVVFVMGKSFPVGSKIPIWVKFVPTEKVCIHRIIASLEERTAYFAKGRRVARHEVPRKWVLLRLLPLESSRMGILPIVSEAHDALETSPVTPHAKAAANYYTEEVNGSTPDILASLMDPFGPWELAMDLEVPSCSGTNINISTNHKKSNIAVSHLVKLSIRVEKLGNDGGERKLYDIIIEAPVTINHSQTANAWLTLPDYWSVRSQDADSPSSPLAETVGESRQAPSSSSISLRRQTAPSLTPGRAPSSSRVEASNRASSPPLTPHQGRVNPRLIQLSQQWLSLSANSDVITSNSSRVTPMTEQVETSNEQTGLPTYAMIDNARGSVDLPTRNALPSVK